MMEQDINKHVIWIEGTIDIGNLTEEEFLDLLYDFLEEHLCGSTGITEENK